MAKSVSNDRSSIDCRDRSQIRLDFSDFFWAYGRAEGELDNHTVAAEMKADTLAKSVGQDDNHRT